MEAIVLLSGGQDSSVALAWAKEKFNGVNALTFDYKQRHSIELDAASKIANLMNVKQTILPISGFSVLGGNSLTDKDIEVRNEPAERGLPNTFVPGRNVIFLTYACAFAYDRGARYVVGGMSQADYSGYPDCRDESIRAIEKALSLAMDFTFIIKTPLMFLSKKDVWAMSYDLGVFNLVKEYSYSCYNGVLGGCGQCNACILRNNALRDFELSLE